MSSSSSSKSSDGEGSDKISKEDKSLSEGEEKISKADRDLYESVKIRNDAAGVQQALRNGANVNGTMHFAWPILMFACNQGNDEIVGILLDAGADP